MVLGRVAHYALDAVLLSTVVAGIRRSSGFVPDTSMISDETVRSVTEKFLGAGETVFDILQSTAINSKYYKRDERSIR
ncbi:hypothetical protein AMATHDRAFT_161424 [Amanita thiersii Skay4041]|uniref:DUF1748-domain-containing protein n=1 Tax=Amanita thiersii Skay4041 TaxID=703135 RepID=A0A2A9NCB2_9AGAR|nr:hypothetical protein AMATHDRAFT_161424 [Amanita thiersii Skay4041]